MKQKNKPTEEFDQWAAWNQSTYRTGGTQPPANHNGLIAFLLVLVIFLGGISTTLGLMNIRLNKQLSDLLPTENPYSVAFSQSIEEMPAFSDPLGFHGEPVTEFWQTYQHLPSGLYITEVIHGSDAFQKGIIPGDILLSVEDVPITDTQILQQVLDGCQAGDSVSLKIHRDGQVIALDLTLE